MTEREVQKWADELNAFHARLGPLLPDRRQPVWLERWIHGLLLDGIRKNAAGLARAVPGADVQSMQQFLSDSTWPWEPMVAELQRIAQETLGEPDGILVCDDTGFAKKGTESVGVSRQYSGTLGKVDNCQIGVFIGYVSGKGRALIDTRLYLPKSWTGKRARMKKAGVPRGVRFKTKPELALEMIAHAAAGPLSAQWVTCDDGYGRDGGFRKGLADLGLLYVCEVPSDQRVWTEPLALPQRAPGQMGRPRTRREAMPGAPKSRKVCDVAAKLETWRRIQVREGAKKPICADWAALRVWPSDKRKPGAEQWLLIERTDADTKYYLSNAPADTELEKMVHVAKKEWFVEPCFRDLKQEVGLGDYEARKWRAWYHHMILCLVAGMFLTVRQTICTKKGSR